MGENQTVHTPMILPGTYTVSGKYLPKKMDFEVAQYQTSDIHFPEIAFINDLDVSTYNTILQVNHKGGVSKFNDPVSDPWGFNLFWQEMDRLSGELTYTLFAVNPYDRNEHHALYSGKITIVPCDDYVFSDEVFIDCMDVPEPFTSPQVYTVPTVYL